MDEHPVTKRGDEPDLVPTGIEGLDPVVGLHAPPCR
jgi:hypothetical protein